MITSQNSKNKLDYGKLFEAVESYMKNHDASGKTADEDGYDGQALMEEDTVITSLNDLFAHMEVLRKLKPQLTRLPIDEDFFEIDVNTRTISIPAQFSKTGVFSVAGDEIAESVYFRVNRYCDHVDLATQEIYIQFINAEGKEYVAIPPVVDIESDPGYMIIEWPISSKVTAAAGNVQFSVRFFSIDKDELDENGERKILYSLSTLASTIAVKASQNFDIAHIEAVESEKKDNNKTLMETRLSGQSLYGVGGAVQPADPEFIEGFELPETINLAKDENGFTTKPVTIDVQANSTDTGIINYSWKAADLDNVEITLGDDVKIAMIKTTDTTPKANKIYYLKTENAGVVGYSKAGAVDAFEADTDYYERVGELVIKEAGNYSVNATNKVGNLEASSEVYTCLVPAAQEPTVVDIVDHVVLAFNDDNDAFEGTIANGATSKDAEGKLTYQWQWSKDGVAFENIATTKDLAISGEVTTMGIVLDDDNEIVDIPVTEKEFLNDTDVVLADGLVSTGNGHRGTKNDDNTPVIFVPKTEDGAVKGDGYYKVIVTNNLNKTTSSKTTNVCRVTHEAIKPDIEVKSGQTLESGAVRIFQADALDNAKGLQVLGSIPEFACETRTDADSITYQWYRYSNDKTPDAQKNTQLEEDIKLAAKGKYVLSNDYRVKDATSATLVLTEADINKGNYYFCRVLNTYNGSKAMRCSRIFEVAKLS